MARLQFTLNQEELLQLIKGDNPDLLKSLLTKTINEVLEMESETQLKAKNYERTEERVDYRNGTRERDFTTRLGTITLEVPRHRNAPFQTMIFENYQRSEAALVNTLAEMVVCGVSTRKISQVMETLCGKEVSKSSVSEACKRLDREVDNFRNRPIEGGRYAFLILDATYFKVRENHKVISKAFMVAIGVTADGFREIIGFGLYDDESNETWQSFVRSLKKRGLSGVVMYTSDAHPSIRNAMMIEYPQVPWQRCQFHFIRNILDKTPDRYKAGLESELREMFHCHTAQEARKMRDLIVSEYNDVAASAMEDLDNGLEDSLSVMLLPETMRPQLRTSNMIERLNKEFKRRSKVIGIFPNPGSVIRLIGSVAIDYSDKMLHTRRLFYGTADANLTEKVRNDLLKLAGEQLRTLKAA